jgi:hypothetical protein
VISARATRYALRGRARQRTGLVSAVISCRVWHETQTSSARVAAAGTSRRFVEPQRVQIHSAVIAPVLSVLTSS